MDLEKMIEEIKVEAVARGRFQQFFEEQIDDWVISFLLTNDHLLKNDIYLFLLDHALTDLAQRNLKQAGKRCTRETTEKEKMILSFLRKTRLKRAKTRSRCLRPV